MTNRILYISFILSILLPFVVKSQDSLIYNGITRDIFIHPADGYTAYTLPKGQWIYTQPIDLKPGVIQVGLDDKNTLILPANHWFEKTVSIGYRRKLFSQQTWMPSAAIETHYQYLFAPVNQVDFNQNIEVWRLGHNYNLRSNFSWKLEKNISVHFSTGFTYTEIFNVNLPDSSYTNDILTGNSLTPDFLLNIEWRAKDWVAFFVQPSYGSTFFYAENTPRKKQILIASRFAPFFKSEKSFFNHLRMEIVYQGAVFDKNNYFYNIVSGNLYWNFRTNNNNP
ncbi:MAG: hypothetical protein D6707_01120 [Bacteroidetes bacterium]|nr:MAG: hypothetical protein D6707_01120 [Bacteroidota bacterium]